MIKNDLTQIEMLNRFLVFLDVKELSGAILYKNGNDEQFINNINYNFFGNNQTKIVNVSTEVLVQYANMLNKILKQGVLVNDTELGVIISHYKNEVSTTIKNNPEVLNQKSILTLLSRDVINSLIQMIKQKSHTLNHSTLTEFENSFLLTDYARESFEKITKEKIDKIEQEADEERKRIQNDSSYFGQAKAYALLDVDSDCCSDRRNVPIDTARDVLASINSQLTTQLSFAQNATVRKK